jgi:hypothetical protein
MMRAVLVLGAIVLASAHDAAQCALDGAQSVDELAETTLNIWAATERCGKTGSKTECAIDIAESISSVNGMINTIVRSVENCGTLSTEHDQCAMAVSELTAASAGLAAAVGNVYDGCPKLAAKTAAGGRRLGHPLDTRLGHCIVNAKEAVTTLFSAADSFSHIHKDCETAGAKCENNALSLVAGLAKLGAFLAGAVDTCMVNPNVKAECAEDSLKLVAGLHAVAKAGMGVSGACKVDEADRLYLENGGKAATSNSMPLALAALLPISAVLSFVAGSRFAKYRSQQGAREPDCEQLMMEE